MPDILILPQRGTSNNPTMHFTGSGANNVRMEVLPSGSVAFIGTSGSLFNITDNLLGSLMAVGDVSGLPILEVFSDDRVVMGKYGKNTLYVSGTNVGVGKVPLNAVLDVSGSVSISGSLNVTSSLNLMGGAGSQLNGNGSTLSLSISGNWNSSVSSLIQLTSTDLNFWTNGGTFRFKNSAGTDIATLTNAGKLSILNGGTGTTNAPLQVAGDIVTYRSSTSGVIYLGSDSAHYVYYDGSNYYMPGGQLYVNSTQVVLNSGTWSISISGNAATATSATSATSATTATTATNWGSYGAVPSAGASFGTANTIGRSDGNGYAYFNYINSNTSNSENPTVSQVIVTNGSDNFYRKASISHFTSAVQSNASGTWSINVSGTAASETFSTVTGRGASTSTQISVGTSAGGSMYTGTKQGSSYGDGISGATFKSITDNPNGGSYAFAAYYNGSGGTNSFYVGAGGNAYFKDVVGIGTSSPSYTLDVSGTIRSTSNLHVSNGIVANAGNDAGNNLNGGVALWSSPGATTSLSVFKNWASVFGRGNTALTESNGYGTYYLMDSSGRGWVWRYVSGGTSGTNVASLRNDTGQMTLGTGYDWSSGYHAQLNISAGQGSASTFRDIDMHGSWASGEGHAITATHGSSATDIVGQMVFQHDSPGSRIRFGKLYHSGNSSNYVMELISTSTSEAKLVISGSLIVTGDVQADFTPLFLMMGA